MHTVYTVYNVNCSINIVFLFGLVIVVIVNSLVIVNYSSFIYYFAAPWIREA